MGKEAFSLGANTFQFFTRNPRGSKAKAIDPADAAALIDFMKDNAFPVVLAHAPYTLNACAEKPSIREFALATIKDDLQRMEFLPNNLYNMHPGNHVGQGVDQGVKKIAETLNHVITPEQTTVLLLETMAGKGTEIGGRFEELGDIITRVNHHEKVGVCLDTCHVFDGGYDIINDLDKVLEHFDKTIGLHRLQAIHLNDSVHGFSSHKDRHARIGEGEIGVKAFERIINHPALKKLPFFLETPNDLAGYAKEIALLRKMYKE